MTCWCGLQVREQEGSFYLNGLCIYHIDGLVQDCSNSSTLAMELLQSCSKPSIWSFSSHAITADVDVVETAKSAEMFHSDGIIITGTATGEPTDVDELAGKIARVCGMHRTWGKCLQLFKSTFMLNALVECMRNDFKCHHSQNIGYFLASCNLSLIALDPKWNCRNFADDILWWYISPWVEIF